MLLIADEVIFGELGWIVGIILYSDIGLWFYDIEVKLLFLDFFVRVVQIYRRILVQVM